jgi:hypothetical protein
MLDMASPRVAADGAARLRISWAMGGVDLLTAFRAMVSNTGWTSVGN